jgi:hypothetical protein
MMCGWYNFEDPNASDGSIQLSPRGALVGLEALVLRDLVKSGTTPEAKDPVPQAPPCDVDPAELPRYADAQLEAEWVKYKTRILEELRNSRRRLNSR